MNGSLQDVRYALRQLRKDPGFTSTTVLTLALAVGISTAAFSVIYAMTIRPLPYDHPTRIFSLDTYSPQGYNQPASYPEYRDWRRENHTFSALAAYNDNGSANLEAPTGPVAVPWVMGSDSHWLPTIGRLKDGVTREQAPADIIAGLAAVLFVLGIVSVLPSARRAASVDPMVALRYE